ncbi:hypothetical protein [Arthrobacter sp. Soil763]|uniref:hypothetical protein n=1 Tax=Arthrobacter sp. Soil763 TaxID=1736402 RepID=UPI0006F9838A|nr:hypothetical protein [Arthrobacter sp. Soil763]KRE81917.1 hypothetical protein ASG71_02365 [Arthrobacter sp. Soil763]
MTAPALRLARGWSGALAATAVAATSHVLAGGTLPEVPLLVLTLALSGLAFTALSGRGLSLWRLSAGVILSQGVFHWLFSGAGAPHAAAQSAVGHQAHLAALEPAAAAAVPAMDHAAPLMWVGHAVAAALTIAVLRRGEVTAVRLVEALRLRVTAFLPLFQPLPPAPAAVEPPAGRPVQPLPNLGVPLLVMRHRGPPAGASAA